MDRRFPTGTNGVPFLQQFACATGIVLFQAAAAYGASLETGSGEVLTSAAIPLASPAVPPAQLRFEFGFTTDELQGPGTFADSFTVSLENSQGQRLYVVTADAAGSLWAPTVPGSFPILPAEIRYSIVDFDPSIDPRSTRFAYRVEVPVPSSWIPDQFQVRLDLFDNRNNAGSAGYVTGAAIVPEPHVLLLTLIGVTAPWWRRRS